MYSIKELLIIPFVCYISVFHSKIILISYLSYIFVSYSSTDLKQYLLFFNENVNEFIEFYHFICENNPLLLNYVDENELKNELKNLNDLVNTTELIKYEDKYLKKFKEFPNKFIFDETELTQEIDERDNIEFEFEKKRSIIISYS